MEKFKKILIPIFLLIFSACNPFEKYKAQTITLNDSIIDKKICLIGDTGRGNPEQQSVATALANENCHLIIHLGDLIYKRGIKNENDSSIETKFIKQYKEIYTKVPMFLALGNHDHYGNARAWINASKNIGVNLPNNFYTLKTPELCFEVIDTIVNFSHGQEQWIKNEMLNNPNKCKHQIVIGHHPFVSSGYHGKSKGLIKKFLETYIIGKTKVYIAGHEHDLSIEQPIKGTHNFVSGAGAATREMSKNHNAFYAQNKLGYMTMTYTKDEKLLFIVRTVENGVAENDFDYQVDLLEKLPN